MSSFPVLCHTQGLIISSLGPERERRLRVIAHEHAPYPWTTDYLISAHLIHLTVILSASPAPARSHRPIRLLLETDADSKTPSRA